MPQIKTFKMQRRKVTHIGSAKPNGADSQATSVNPQESDGSGRNVDCSGMTLGEDVSNGGISAAQQLYETNSIGAQSNRLDTSGDLQGQRHVVFNRRAKSMKKQRDPI